MKKEEKEKEKEKKRERIEETNMKKKILFHLKILIMIIN